MTPDLEEMAVRLFGRPPVLAHIAKRCIRCWRPVGVEFLDPEDAAEYWLSAFCPDCFETVMPPEED
jgi:hypothetical protein